MRRQNRAVVLASGGLDSAALLGWALLRYKKVQPVYCRFGLRWERAELHWLRKFLGALKRTHLLPLIVLEVSTKQLAKNHWSVSGKGVPGKKSQDKDVYLPGRNALLLTQTAIFSTQRGYEDILLGTLKGNPFSDATPPFFNTMARALTLALGEKVNILAPFRKMSKETALRPFHHLPLHLAFSCLNPKALLPCGNCNKCAEKERLHLPTKH